ncbi:hypothetical protein PBF_10677 [Cytobacillus firmus DS1]|uniref:Uncharacterized protein n=1 Tax=Cytobacillus firmus DS1 TaxID=1307436 RepID=W7KTW4_CYTFI|nr:hypothetical protein PBF_10677 [Cytobacillus firmus DS1]
MKKEQEKNKRLSRIFQKVFFSIGLKSMAGNGTAMNPSPGMQKNMPVTIKRNAGAGLKGVFAMQKNNESIGIFLFNPLFLFIFSITGNIPSAKNIRPLYKCV